MDFHKIQLNFPHRNNDVYSIITEPQRIQQLMGGVVLCVATFDVNDKLCIRQTFFFYYCSGTRFFLHSAYYVHCIQCTIKCTYRTHVTIHGHTRSHTQWNNINYSDMNRIWIWSVARSRWSSTKTTVCSIHRYICRCEIAAAAIAFGLDDVISNPA